MKLYRHWQELADALTPLRCRAAASLTLRHFAERHVRADVRLRQHPRILDGSPRWRMSERGCNGKI